MAKKSVFDFAGKHHVRETHHFKAKFVRLTL